MHRPIRAQLGLALAGSFVGFDLLLQFLELFARNQADLLQRREVLFGFRKVVHDQVSLADIFMRAAVTRTERERALIVPESGIQLAGVAVGVTEVVLDIGIARVAQRCRGERRDGRTPLLGFDRLLARGVVGIKLRPRPDSLRRRLLLPQKGSATQPRQQAQPRCSPWSSRIPVKWPPAGGRRPFAFSGPRVLAWRRRSRGDRYPRSLSVAEVR